MKNIVKFLRRSQEFDWTQDQLAERVGVSRATISAIENGASTSIEIGIRIANAFNRDPREIFFADDVAHSLHERPKEYT
ncbi:helix-turn-helix transcriptional regulator [Brevibacillus sp. B_LB10_24]|uniref:helix-turn-helix transcriptional regulator n=1 Tax=Brevibacillus sp. B_LB10_24 TaxID=3380645 RepID=UPI0038B8410C